MYMYIKEMFVSNIDIKTQQNKLSDLEVSHRLTKVQLPLRWRLLLWLLWPLW